MYLTNNINLFFIGTKYSPILVFKQLKHIDLIDGPISGFIMTDICLLLIILYFMILTSFIKKVGKKLRFPNGPNLFISLINFS